ncbi:type III secretion apparatus lipoprotein, YscJ/HrcJ family [Burkholderiales bacterium JOSHI_001]|nr:type III secretion apparatus lipoprotein, YscJ/HrcJ family [Burkholderiales bacterium JOSHI_001]
MSRAWVTRSSRLALAGLLAATLAACGEQALYSNLSERQANEMVAALRAGGLDAQKQIQDGHYAVLTAPGQFAPAMQLLNAQGLPRETFDTMGKVFKREGFVSSPLEERARLQHAMSQEIANTLAQIDGVVTARVHLVVPERNPLADKAQPAAASVFIKHRPERDMAMLETKIKALVVNSIEGLAYDNVTVALFPADAMPAGSNPTPPDSPAARQAGLALPLLFGSAAGALALGGGGLLWWRRRLTTHTTALPAPDAVDAGLTNRLQDALQRLSRRA